jgi:hypothetical protein
METLKQMEAKDIATGNRIILESQFVSDTVALWRGKALLESRFDWLVSKAEFHSNWSWLMPVVEKINTIAMDNVGEIGVWIYPHKCLIGRNEFEEIVSFESHHTPLIKLVWQAIVAFLEYYNQQSKQP